MCDFTAAEPLAAPAAFPFPVFDRDGENSRIEGILVTAVKGIDLSMAQEGKKIRILMISGQDGETDPEIRAVSSHLAETCPDRAEIVSFQARKIREILPAAEKAQADVIHLCGYCTLEGSFYLMDGNNSVQWTKKCHKGTLIRQMSRLTPYPKVFYVDGFIKECELKLGIGARIDLLIGMEDGRHPETSLLFAPAIYEFLCRGDVFAEAFKKADALMPKRYPKAVFRFMRRFVNPEAYRMCEPDNSEQMESSIKLPQESQILYR